MTLKGRIERLEQSGTVKQSETEASQRAYVAAGGWRGLLTRVGVDVGAVETKVKATGCSPAEATAAALGVTSGELRQALGERGS